MFTWKISFRNSEHDGKELDEKSSLSVEVILRFRLLLSQHL